MSKTFDCKLQSFLLDIIMASDSFSQCLLTVNTEILFTIKMTRMFVCVRLY